MKLTHQAAQSHSVVGYTQRLSTEELFHLLRCHLESKSDSAFYAEEIIAILESRLDETQS